MKIRVKNWQGLGLPSAIVMAMSLAFALPAQDAAAEPSSKQAEDTKLETSHNSMLLVKENELPTTKQVRLGINKAMVIEFPRELRDVMVSNPEIADANVQSTNRVHLIGKKIGQSNAFFFDSNGEQILTLELTVEYDTAVLDSLFKRLLPGSNIKTEMLNQTVILTGSVRNPVDSTRARDIASRFIVNDTSEKNDRHKLKVINMLSVEAEEQVMLRVVVAEVQRTLAKQMGINLSASINSGNFSTNLLTSNALPLTTAAGLGGLPVPGVGTAALAAGGVVSCATAGVLCNYNEGPGSAFGNSGTSGGWSSGGNSINQAIRMLERDGLIKTLAEPNLTAISGEPAKFLAGGEYPIPVVDSQGKTTVEYKEFGVGVAFTPTVMSEGRISLKIESEVSELTNVGAVAINNLTIPALKKRQANSTVELPSGGSLALAGLISDDVRQNIDGVPGMKDLPILGTLFRSRDFIKQETELVIIVTPLLVKAVASRELAKPVDGLGIATDMKANFMGHLNRVYGSGGSSAPAGDLKGDYGFIVE
jgi:pilus assembly protein CpaC